MKLSVVICTHNPRQDYLDRTIASIRTQARDRGEFTFELIVIDNSSLRRLEDELDLSWHPDARVVREDRLGLSYARLRSFEEAQGDIIVFVDDDNVLAADYLANVACVFSLHAELGAIGGKSIPEYEVDPPAWFHETGLSLACRDLGDSVLSAAWSTESGGRFYPVCAPIGAGMAVRRSAYEGYIRAAALDERRLALGRRGSDLASGEDNDIVLAILEQGWRVAYRPELLLNHLIPAGRLTQDYLERYARSANRTWVKVLDVHGICPWTPISSWTIPIRRARAYLLTQPWRSPERAICYMAQRGLFEGRAAIKA